MVSKAKRKARREEEEAAAAAAPGEPGAASEGESDSDEEEAPRPRPGKRAKAGQEAGAAAEPGLRNKEKPLVLCSRGIPGRCVGLAAVGRGAVQTLGRRGAEDESIHNFIHACQPSGQRRADATKSSL